MRVHIDAVGLALATAGEVRHYDGPGGRVDPELVGFGAYEVCSAEACGDDERVPDGVVQEQVEDLGLGEEIGDGAVEVVAEADVETEAMADGEGEDDAGEDELVGGRDDVEDDVGELEAQSGDALGALCRAVRDVDEADVLEGLGRLVDGMLHGD